MAAAALSLPCPLRRSTRLAHAHTHTHHPATKQRQSHTLNSLNTRHVPRPPPDPEPDQDSSSSDPENELTPRALRALKRQRLALDVDGLAFPPRPRQKKRRKENIPRTDRDDSRPSHLPRKDVDCPKRPSSPTRSPIASQCTYTLENTATSNTAVQPSAPSSPLPEPNRDSPHDTTLAISTSSPQSDATTFHELSLVVTFPNKDNDSQELSAQLTTRLELSIPISPISAEPLPVQAIPPRDASTSPEPLTPLTPSPEASPSLPGHDRPVSVPPSPSPSLLPPPVSLENLPLPHSSDSTQRAESLPSPSSSTPSPLNPVVDTLIPFGGLPPQFEHELAAQMTSSPSQPPQPPQLPVLDFPEQFPPFQQPPQIYVPPYPDPRREANIWKLACRERVDYILKCTRKTIKELLAPEFHTNSQETYGSRPPSHSPSLDSTGTDFNATRANTPSQTKFRLYTPASYTYSSTSWGSSSGARKALSFDEDMEDADAGWSMDDSDWVDGDVDMEDDDDDDYEDDDDVGAEGEAEGTLGAVEGLAIGDSSTFGTSTTPALDPPLEVDKSQIMQVDPNERTSSGRSPTKAVVILSMDSPTSSRLPTLPIPPVDPSRPSTPPYLPSSPVTPDRLPSLSSLHVPILSEPSRSFMGRGTPPDRRRLIEWSGAGRFATNGMGPPLYLSPVPQRHASTDVGIVPMSVDEPIHPATSEPQHSPGEWTSFLYSMLEGDGVGVDTSVTDVSHGSESAWYELGLGSVPASDLGVTLSNPDPHPRTPTVEQVVDDGSSSSTLRFALG